MVNMGLVRCPDEADEADYKCCFMATKIDDCTRGGSLFAKLSAMNGVCGSRGRIELQFRTKTLATHALEQIYTLSPCCSLRPSRLFLYEAEIHILTSKPNLTKL